MTAEEPAVLPRAALYAGPGYPYAVEDAASGPIHGELVTAAPSAHDPLLAALDLLEEYAPDDPRNLYERVVREVTRTADGTTALAWVYVAAPRVAERLRASGTVIGGGDWSSARCEP
ncbi:Gamma-glutamylcyclotransferase OS=Streptomyces alboniger OX=132473 GN=CP975_11085 PE=4 SV=1 [Streptomyces alboniger]